MESERELTVQKEKQQKEAYAKKLRELLMEIDTDHSGTINLEKLENCLKDEHLMCCFSALQIDLTEFRKLFMILDSQMNGCVEIDEFTSGCVRMKGEAKSSDLHILMHENKLMNKHWHVFVDRVEYLFDAIKQQIAVMQATGSSNEANQPPLLPESSESFRKEYPVEVELNGLQDNVMNTAHNPPDPEPGSVSPSAAYVGIEDEDGVMPHQHLMNQRGLGIRLAIKASIRS